MVQSNGASPAPGGGLGNERTVRFRRLACALAALALLGTATACSASGSSSSGGDPSSSVTLALTIAAPTSAPVYVAQSQGFFKQQGLNVTVRIIPDAYESLATGQIQFGLIGVSQAVQTVDKGVGLQQICVTQTDPSYLLAVSQKTMTAKGITSSMSLKETLTKLQGEVVTEVGGAVNPGSILLESLLKKNGLPSDWIKIVSETSNASATASFIEGQVGVVFQPQPQPDELLAKVPGKIIFNTAGSSLFPGLSGAPWSAITASTSYLAAHPDTAKEICGAIAKADNYINSDPAGAAKAIEPQVTGFSTTAIQKALPTYNFAADAKMSQSQFDTGVKALASYGLFQEPSASQMSSLYTTKYQS
ncbi:MAG TPA: ABC transporter substrate-binding protein [Trebonia sp.]|jgi:NitT/TauT family transport system substrate-binding protein